MAGLVYYYDDLSYYYFYMTRNEKGECVLQLLACVMGRHTWPLGHGIVIGETETIWLKLKTEKEIAHFAYSLNGVAFHQIEPAVDAIVLSDDYYYKFDQYRFTGAFIGICCQDLAYHQAYADFDYFEYREQ